MKKILFCLVGFTLFFQIFSQDIIYKNDGSEIQSNIVEITVNAIKYKNFNQPNGPIRNILINDVFMIIYKDGTKEVFKGKYEVPKQNSNNSSSSDANENIEFNNSQPQVNSQTIKVPEKSSFAEKQFLEVGGDLGQKIMVKGTKLSSHEVRKLMAPYPDALNTFNSGRVLSGFGTAFALTGIGAFAIVYGSTDNVLSGLIALVPLWIADAICTTSAARKFRASVSLYNNSIYKSVSYKLDFGIQENGIGFALKF
jgi:hypothetical protein